MTYNGDVKAADSSEFWKIIHIPEKPSVLPQLQATVNVVAAAIEPKHANTIVRKLNHITPLDNLRHVKRIRKKYLDGGKSELFMILCLASGDDDDKPNSLPEDVLELVNTYQLSTFITKVCKFAASTKEEWEEQCKLWPTSFHPPTYNIEGITGFTEEDSRSIFNFMKMAVQMAKSILPVVNAAVIVDPSTGQVIASSCDEVLSYSFMDGSSEESCCSKRVESTISDSGLQMKTDPCSSTEAFHKRVSCLHPWDWPEHQLDSSLKSWHPLRHAGIVAIEKSAARDRRLFPVNGHEAKFALEDFKVSSPNHSPSKRRKMEISVKHEENMECERNGSYCDSTRPYLCTGYDIFFVWEPCIMCAMAIVHQRIRRVFYAFPNPNDGALGSVHRLQGERSLNHHYAVFRVVLPQDILKPGDFLSSGKTSIII